MRKAFFEPFMKEGQGKIVEEEFNGEIAKIRAMVESNNVTWDVVENDSMTTLAACAEGIVEKIDWDKIGLKREDFISADASECVVPSILYATVLAYDTTKLKDPPTSIAAFLRHHEVSGKRGLQKSPFVNLEWALIADGVAKEDVYKVLSTPEGLDRAFAKLDTIKKDVVWWEAGAQPPQTPRRRPGRDDLGVERAHLQRRDEGQEAVPDLWDHQALDWQGWNVVKGSKNRDPRVQVHGLRGRRQAPGQPDQLHLVWSRNKMAIPNVNPEIVKDLPTNPDNMKTAFIIDAKFWGDNLEAIRERFNVWVAQ